MRTSNDNSFSFRLYFSMLAVGVHQNIFYLFWKSIESPSKALLMRDLTWLQNVKMFFWYLAG